MSVEDCLSTIAASVRNKKPRSQNLLYSYQEAVHHLLNECMSDQAIVEIDTALPHYVHPSNTTPNEYADALVPTSFKVADGYDESTVNDVIIEGFDASIRNRLRKYW